MVHNTELGKADVFVFCVPVCVQKDVPSKPPSL